jgi:hypothetical protein
MSKRVLLVEGATDKMLLKAVLSQSNILDIEIYPPKDLGAKGNGISNVMKLLPVILGKIQSEDFDNFGILVDADYQGINGGFQLRRQEVETVLAAAGYSRNINVPPTLFGDVFTHPTNIPIHLGILPDHASDGMVEHMLANSVSTGNQANLFAYAQSSINSLPTVLFNNSLHLKKAEIATLLAFQQSPGCDAGIGVKSGTFDLTAPDFAKIVSWLRLVFP